MFRCPKEAVDELEHFLLNNVPSQKVRDEAPIRVRIQFLLLLWWPRVR